MLKELCIIKQGMLYISKTSKRSKASLYKLSNIILGYLKPCTKTTIAYTITKP